MYYQFTILVLFRPLIGLRIIGSSIIPGDVCLQAADAIQGLLRSYTQLYTLRRTPSIVPYIVLASSVMHLAIGAYTPSPNSTSPPTSLSLPSYAQGRKGSSDHAFPRRILPGTRPESGLSASPSLPVHNMRVAETISQGISDLTEMASCHRFAEQALHTLRDFAKQRGIKLNISQSGTLSEQGTYQLVRPQPSNPNSPVPGITEHNFSSTWGANGERILNSGGTLLTLEGLTDRQQQQQQPLALAMDMPAQFPRKNVPTSREDHSKDSTNPAAHLLQEVANTPPIWFEEKSEPMADTAKSIENILYWPFAMPDRSTVPTAHLLKEAGFELLL